MTIAAGRTRDVSHQNQAPGLTVASTSQRSCRSNGPRVRSTPYVLALILCGSLWQTGHAQREATPTGVESVFLDVDAAAAKKLAAVRDLLAAHEWGDAIDLMRQIGEQHGDRLVAIAPRRYVSVQTYCDILLSSLPEARLKLYRARTDPQARRWFETARVNRDEEGLRKILRRAFLGSYGDDALLLLGQLAWEQGRLPQARQYWEQLLPPNAAYQPGGLPDVLRYPAGDIDEAQVRARLVLCSLQEGQLARSRRELAAFRQLHPQATGTLAARTGNLGELLTTLIDEASEAASVSRESEQPTFAGNLHRNPVQPEGLDVGSVQWRAPLPSIPTEKSVFADDPFDPQQTGRNIDKGPGALSANILNFYPVVFENRVFYCDETSVYARELLSAEGGRPAWGDDATIYRLAPELHPQLVPGIARAGWPRFTVSIDRNRLYARLGGNGRRRIRGLHEPSSLIVCLDLIREGELAWSLKADEIGGDGANWAFDGSPIAADGRVYVALRRSEPQLQLNVACFDAATAKLLWNRKVCLGLESLPPEVEQLHHQLLTLADDRLYYCTNLGAIAALETRDGSIRWVTTYPRAEIERVQAYNLRHRQGPNPCLYQGGLVFAAPTDGDRVFAFDSETGILQWERELKGGVPQLLGADDGKLVVAGDLLWGLEADTGKDAWIVGQGDDPAAATRGRGVIAGGLVYWPRPEEIQLVELASGRILRAIDLKDQHGVPGGGNLAISKGWMLLAQASRLVAFSEFGSLRKQRKDEILRRPDDPQPHFELARLAEVAKPLDEAEVETEYAQALALAKPGDRCDARPMRLVAAERLARWHERQDLFAKAAADWQRLLDESPATDEIGDDEAPFTRQHARREIDRLIDAHGREVYAAIERTAEAAFAAALGRRDFDAIETLVARFPHAAAAEPAALQCAAARRAAGNLYRSDAISKGLLTQGRHETSHPAALTGLAQAAEQRHCSNSAIRWWQQLYDEHAAAQIVVGGMSRPAQEVAAERLTRLRADLAGQPSVDVSADPLMRAWSRDMPGGARVRIPEGTPPAFDRGCVLIDGDSIVCINATDGAARWQADLLEPLHWSGYVGDVLVLGMNSTVAGLDPDSGQILWYRTLRSSRLDRGTAQLSFRTAGDRLTCLVDDSEIVSISPEKGELEWRYRPGHGRLQPHWSADRDRLVVQILAPDRWQVLGTHDGSLLGETPGSPVAWHSDPQPLLQSRQVALAAGRRPVQVVDTIRVSVLSSDQGPQSIRQSPPDLLAGFGALVVVIDGDTLARIDPGSGQRLWSCQAGVAPLREPRSAACFDSERLFVASGGVLRCVDLAQGRLLWEQYLGTSTGDWRVVRAGPWLAAYPAQVATGASVVLCDRVTGAFVQRLVCDPAATAVQFHGNASQAIVATDRRLMGYRPMSQVADAR
ncbi:MAG: hypothetical protein EXS05_16800 [Planctomycetaceae bacterium]|nr:hypothetical protein [Planctomycetaceae bacterium]